MLPTLRLLSAALVGWVLVAGFAWSHLSLISTACASGAYDVAARSPCVYHHPQDLTISKDGRFLYVADGGHDRVAVLDAHTLALVGVIGAGLLSAPHDVSLGPDGRLYVADAENGRVAIFAVTATGGTFEGALEGFTRPEGVLAHPNGRVYVADDDGGRIVVFQDGARIAELGGFSRPHDLEASGDSVLIVEAGTHRVGRFSADLAAGPAVQAEAPFQGPRYLAIAEDGTLAVVEKMGHQVSLLSAAGEKIGQLGSGRAGLAPGQLKSPEGAVFFGKDLFISDSGNGRILKYAPRAELARRASAEDRR